MMTAYERVKKWRQNHPEENLKQRREYEHRYRIKYPERLSTRKRNGSLKQKYGITYDEKRALLEEQDWLCKLCDKPIQTEKYPSKDYAVVDHDHKTGRIRGILCQSCNRTLGKIKDSKEYLKRIVEYL